MGLPAPRSDARLVADCRAGDASAWNELVERFGRYVYAIATRAYGLQGADAEDVFQDVFARAYTQLETLRDDGALRQWLGQLCRRLCVDRLRASRRETPSDEIDPPGSDETLARIDEALTVWGQVAALPEHCQEIIDRFFARDESYQQIGAALGIPPGTIASRISRCLARLRELLEGRSEAPAPS